MGNSTDKRHTVVTVIFFILMAALFVRLYWLSVVQSADWTKAAEELSTRTVYTTGARGGIFDRCGRVMAENREIFSVHLIAAEMQEDRANDVAQRLTELLEKNGDGYEDDFPIILSEDGSFYYTYEREIEKWLAEQGMEAGITASEAFDQIRERYNIDAGLDPYEIQEILQNTYSVFPPISAKTMEYTSRMERNAFLESFHLDTQLDAASAFAALREKYGVDPALPDYTARKILIVRNALKNLGYQSYLPAEIARDVSRETVIELEEYADDFPGVEVVTDYVRQYPYGSTGSHVLGYLGRISESEQSEYLEKGYSSTDLIGKEGVESFFESDLRGKNGEKLIEVDANGRLVSTIRSTDSEPGGDVTLTIDMKLQEVAEQSLEKAMEAIRTGGTYTSRFGNFKFAKTFRNCTTGAAVVVDVKTGEVLALASCPGYDPNLFASGISAEDWNSLQSVNPWDSLSARPLYDIATLTSVQPGSTFKPVTALNALDQGFSDTAKLKDNGYIEFSNKRFGCWIWNEYHQKHGWLDIRSALEVSCNYFFYDLGTGYDFASGSRILESDIHDVMAYAEKLGLGQKTGIELRETAAGVPSEESKVAGMASQLRYYLKMNAETLFEDEVFADPEKEEQVIETITGWITEDLSSSELRERLKEAGVREDRAGSLSSVLRSEYFTQSEWTTGDQLNLSIGQGENSYTPVQMARYVAAVANDGLLNRLTLCREINGVPAERSEGTQVENSNPEAWQIVRDGMHRVAQGSSGTARRLFYGFPYTLGAKTGTAQKSGKISVMEEAEYIREYLPQIAPGLSMEEVEEEMRRLLTEYPDLYTSESAAVRRAVMNLAGVSTEQIDRFKESYDNFSWFVAFSPYEDPEIAVAVLLVQGGSGSYAGTVARELIGQYYTLQDEYEQGNYDVDVDELMGGSGSSTSSAGTDPDV